MRCEEVNEYMQRDLDHDLNDEEQRKLMDHMAFCEECAAMYERLKKLSGELEQLPDVKPAYSLVDAIIPQLDLLDRHPASSAAHEGRGIFSFLHGRRFNWKWVSGTVAAGLLVAAWIVNAQLNNSMDSASEFQRSGEAQPPGDARQFNANIMQDSSARESAELARSLQAADGTKTSDEARPSSDEANSSLAAKPEAKVKPEENLQPADEANSAQMLMAPLAPDSNAHKEHAEIMLLPGQAQSPSGQLAAMAELLETGEQQIVIRDQQGQPLFTGHPFSREWQVSYEWLGDEALIYHLILEGQDGKRTEAWKVYLQGQGTAPYEQKQE